MVRKLAIAGALALVCTPALAFEDSARPENMVAMWNAAPVSGRGRIHLEPEYPVRLHGPRGSSLAGVYAPLAAKAQEIAAACGSAVISGVRHTRVAGTRRMSLHASGHAVDMKGNPSCIYAHLRSWSGGYSIDYGRVHHVHISLGGREDGLRFAHGGHRRHYAHRRHHRYARA